MATANPTPAGESPVPERYRRGGDTASTDATPWELCYLQALFNTEQTSGEAQARLRQTLDEKNAEAAAAWGNLPSAIKVTMFNLAENFSKFLTVALKLGLVVEVPVASDKPST